MRTKQLAKRTFNPTTEFMRFAQPYDTSVAYN